MKKRNPRHGSMQFWPRKRASRETASVRSWAKSADAKLLGFAGYKVGMTQIGYTDNKKTSLTKGQDIITPVTVIECPPIKIVGARAYKKELYATNVVAQTITSGKDVAFPEAKNQTIPAIDKVDVQSVDYVVAIVQTNPSKTGIGKKTPEVFETAIGGSVEDQIAFVTEHLGKEVAVSDVFNAGAFVDIHAVTKGYGTQGPVKRFGINLKQKKSEKGQRAPGSISGGWVAQQHMMYRVAYAGQTGYHLRTDYNKMIMLVDSDVSKINPKGGFVRYGEVKSTYILLAGSVPGPRKRLLRITKAVRSKVEAVEAPALDYISVESKQG
ncbi:MAG: 50S ribosomal protein L3 [Candidatus Woesearchaeota archaeon]